MFPAVENPIVRFKIRGDFVPIVAKGFIGPAADFPFGKVPFFVPGWIVSDVGGHIFANPGTLSVADADNDKRPGNPIANELIGDFVRPE